MGGMVSLQQLLADAADAARIGDTLSLYANLWQSVVQHPSSSQAWGELAATLATQHEWQAARRAARTAMDLGVPYALESARPILKCLAHLAEQVQLGDLEWSHWFDLLPDECKAIPFAIALLANRGDTDACDRLPIMLRQNPGDPKALLVASVASFGASKFSDAYRYLRGAFEADLRFALWEVVNKYGAQVSRTLHETRKSDELADLLAGRWTGDAELVLMPANDTPASYAEVAGMRNLALDRGLPSPLLVTQAKSASVSVANIFNSGFGLPSAVYSLLTNRVVAPWLAEYLRGGACYTTHLVATDSNVGLLAQGGASHIIVHVRDPRQLIVSRMEHFRRYASQIPYAEQSYYSEGGNDALEASLGSSLVPVVEFVQQWLNARRLLPVEFTTFEEFVGNRARFVDRMLSLYGGDTRYFDKAAALVESPGTDYHRRTGLTDEWRNRLSTAQIDRINQTIPNEFWSEFGWRP